MLGGVMCLVAIARSATIVQCLDSAGVPQYETGTADFSQSIKPFNSRLPFTPTAVAVPSTVGHIQSAVGCAVQLGLSISPKSGGHSYASHGLGGEDGHLMVDLKYWNNISLNTTTGVATIGPGCRLGNVALALYSQGNASISHGTCPGVGVGGHVLHGGYGLSSHTYGLALDNLVSADVVLADGSLVKASESSHADLYWALRGAGSSYGIVTSFEFKTHAAPENNTVFSYYFNWNETQARNGFTVLQNFANTTVPKELNMRLLVNSFQFQLMGVYFGSQESFLASFMPILAQLGEPSRISISSKSWLDTLGTYAYDSLAQPSPPLNYNNQENFFSKSLMTVAVNEEAITAFWSYWAQNATKINRAWFLIIDLHGGPGSAVTQVPADATSYAHRKALLKYEFYDRVYSGNYPSNGFNFLNGWVETITGTMNETTFGMYVNYADPTLSLDEAHKYYVRL
jgi:hypothetical protein